MIASIVALCITWVQADLIRTRAGIGYTGQIVGLDKQALVIKHSRGDLAIHRMEIVSIEVDQHPDLAKAERFMGGGVTMAAQAEHLYASLLDKKPAAWLAAFVQWRLFQLRLSVSRHAEALDAYLYLVRENPQFAEGLVWPAITEPVSERRADMLAKIDEVIKKTPPEPLSGELQKLRNALTHPGPVSPEPPPSTPMDAPPSKPVPIAKAAEIPLPRILAEANQRIKALTDDQELTSAQRSAGIEKELASLRRIVESRVWIMPCELVDISKARDHDHLHEAGKPDDPVDWSATVRIPDLAGTVVTVRMSMHESEALALKKGQGLHIQCELGLERSPREPFGLSVMSASVYKGQLPAAGPAAGAEVTFLGIKGTASRKIVYIVDRSGSMSDSIGFVKHELKRSIGNLDEAQEFHIIFYSSGPPVEMPTRRLVAATKRNKQLAFEFVDSVIPQGETDPSKALERAFACGAELIYLLTDGEFDKAIVDLVRRANVGHKVTVHTIGFLYKSGEAILKQIAEQNSGNYRFVSEQDLATLTQ
jgi:hypothetical protein